MRRLGEIYKLNHGNRFQDCTKVDNCTLYMALTLKLRKMLGHGDVEQDKELEAAELFYEQMAKHCPRATWQQIVDACEDRVINEHRVNITPANVVKWSKNHYDCLPKKTEQPDWKRIDAPQDAPEEFYKERYMCCLAQWAHDLQVWDVNSFAYEYLIRTGKLSKEIAPSDMQRVKELAAEYARREELKVKRGQAPLLWNIHAAMTPTHVSAVKHARLLRYFELHEERQTVRAVIEKPTTALGYL